MFWKSSKTANALQRLSGFNIAKLERKAERGVRELGRSRRKTRRKMISEREKKR